jgi:hypothetical protein
MQIKTIKAVAGNIASCFIAILAKNLVQEAITMKNRRQTSFYSGSFVHVHWIIALHVCSAESVAYM